MLENTEGAIEMENPEELVPLGDEKQNKNTTQYVLNTTICKQTQIA